jgi:hypothetical protein
MHIVCISALTLVPSWGGLVVLGSDAIFISVAPTINALADAEGAHLTLQSPYFCIKFLVFHLKLPDYIAGLVRHQGWGLESHSLCKFCALLVKQCD